MINIVTATSARENISVESWGTRFRRTICASLGRVYVKFDYKSFHALMMGHLAGDAAYSRLAGIDIHAFIAARMIGEPAQLQWSDSDLRGYLKEIRGRFPEIRDRNAKVAILGWQLGMEGGTLWRNNRDIYPKRRDADAALRMIDEEFDPCVQYRQDKMMQAHKQGFLLSPYGYQRWFWDVYRSCPQCHYRNRERCSRCKGLGLTPGEEAKEAISHDVQSCAHGHIKDVMLEIHRQGLDEEAGLVNQVHDDLQFDMPRDRMDELIPRIQSLMEFANPLLGGLRVAVDVKTGANLADMD